MIGVIDANGNLKIKKKGRGFVSQICKNSENKPCGMTCPFFGEPERISDFEFVGKGSDSKLVRFPVMIGVKICENKIIKLASLDRDGNVIEEEDE